MSEMFWESEVMVEDQLGEQALFESRTQHDPEPVQQPQDEPLAQPESQPQPEQQAHSEQLSEAGIVALSVDDFSALEDRILRAVELVKRERQARSASDERAAQAEVQLGEQAHQVVHLQTEVQSLRAERDHVRQRVERLVAQLDALEL